MMKIIFLLLLASAIAAPIDNLKLKFKISARDLPDKDNIGKGDPYVELFYTENDSKDEVKLGKTSTLNDNANPDWGETFEFDFVRSKRQRFILRLYDEDNFAEDDKLGVVYIEVADFVDKGQHLTATLTKKGYVILDTVNPVVTPAPPAQGVASQPANIVQVAPTPLAKTPLTNPEAFPLKLRFKISARDLPNKDQVGESDPFAEIQYTEGTSTKLNKVGTTAVINDNNNPNWGEVFDFQYDPAKAQKWFFEIRDSDYGESDGLGKVWVEVSDYVAKGQKITVNLIKKGTLTIQSADSVTPASGTAQQAGAVTPATKPPPPVVTVPPVMKLKFRLSAKGLEDRDVLGTSDPYVKVYYKQGTDSEVFIGNTQKFQDLEDVNFPDVFEFDYNPSLDPKFHFLVLDEDANRTDEELGNVWCDVSQYVKSGENLVLKLKKGTLTVAKA